MKLSKKILLGAAAILAVGLVFSGCKEEEGETGDVGKDFVLENTENNEFLRGWSTVKTKHTSATAKITIKDATKYLPKDGTSLGGNGVVGFIFGLHDYTDADGKNTTYEQTYKDKNGNEKKETKNGQTFGIIGVRRTSATDAYYYVSWFENSKVPPKDGLMSDADFKNVTTGNSAEKYDATKTQKNSSFVKLTNPKAGEDYVIWAKLEATGDDLNGNGKVENKKVNGVQEGDGGYKVTIYDNVKDAKGKDTMGTTEVSSVTIPAAQTGDTFANQYDLGLYTNVYGGSTANPTKLEGRIDLSSYVNDVEVELVFED